MSNTVGRIIKIIGGIIIAIGVVAGLIGWVLIADEISGFVGFLSAIGIFVGFFVVGIMFVGFSEIICLLQDNYETNRKIFKKLNGDLGTPSAEENIISQAVDEKELADNEEPSNPVVVPVEKKELTDEELAEKNRVRCKSCGHIQSVDIKRCLKCGKIIS